MKSKKIALLIFLLFTFVFFSGFVEANVYIEKVELNREPAVASLNSFLPGMWPPYEMGYGPHYVDFLSDAHLFNLYVKIKVINDGPENFNGNLKFREKVNGDTGSEIFTFSVAGYSSDEFILRVPSKSISTPREYIFNIDLINLAENRVIDSRPVVIDIKDPSSETVVGPEEDELGEEILFDTAIDMDFNTIMDIVASFVNLFCTMATGLYSPSVAECFPGTGEMTSTRLALEEGIKDSAYVTLSGSRLHTGSIGPYSRDLEISWRNRISNPVFGGTTPQQLFLYYDRAVIVLQVPKEVEFISAVPSPDKKYTINNTRNIVWIVNGVDKRIIPSNIDRIIKIVVKEPFSYNYTANVALMLQLGPFENRSDFMSLKNIQKYNYTKWKTEPNKSTWFTLSSSIDQDRFSSKPEDLGYNPIFTGFPYDIIVDYASTPRVNLGYYLNRNLTPDYISQLLFNVTSYSNVKVAINQSSKLADIILLPNWTGRERVDFIVKDTNGRKDVESVWINSKSFANLAGVAVYPADGNLNDVFTYSVKYISSKGNAPINAEVFIDGKPHSMLPTSGKISSGKTYTYSTKLPNGNHNYYFEFVTSDGIFRYPESGVLSGPSVTVPPTLLENGYVTPASGIETTKYDYYVTYKNPSGQAPKYNLQVVIDNGYQYCDMYPVSSDFTNGAVYKCSTATLSLGQHNYYFIAHLKDDSVVRYPLNTALIGPSVADSGNLQVSIVPRANYNVGDNAWFDITIKDPTGTYYIDPDGQYPIQVCQVPPFSESACYYVQRSDVGRYYTKQWPWSLAEGYTTITATVDKQGYKPVSVSIQYFFGNISALNPVKVDNIKINPLSINPGVSKVNISYNISKDALVTIKIIDSNNDTIRNLINHASRNSGLNVEEWDGKDKNGNYVSDDNYLIKIEAVNVQAMQNIAPFGVSGRGYGQLLKPRGIWVKGDKIYVTDIYPIYKDTYKVSIFKKDTSLVKEFGNSDIFAPMSIALDSNGNIYVISTLTYDPEVKVFDNNGNYMREFGGGIINQNWEFHKPPYITIDKEDYIYVCSGQIVYKFSISGNLLNSFSIKGLDSHDTITGVSVDEEKNIWVASYNSVIKKLDQNGDELLTFITPSNGVGVSVRRDGIIFTRGSEGIYAQDEDGTFLYSQNCPSENGQNGIYTDSDGYVYATCSTDGNKELNTFKDLSTKDSKTARISADRNPPMARISEPLEGEVVDGHYLNEIEIRGNADDSEFDYYLLEWSSLMQPGAWHLISRGNVSVENSFLGKWGFENLNSGNYTIRLSVYDKSGTVSQASVSIVYIDNVAPSAQLRNTGNATVNNMIIVEAASSDEDTKFVNFEYKKEGGEWKSMGIDYNNDYFVNFDTRNLEEGKYELRAIATDTANNTDSSPSSISLRVDNDAPSIEITNPINNSKIEDSVNISAFALNESVSSVLFQYRRLGDLLWVNIGSMDSEEPWSREWNTQYLYSGKYELRALAIDDLGNIDEKAKIIEVNVIHKGAPIEENFSLLNGWNLISIPISFENNSVESVFSSIINKVIVINSFKEGAGGGALTYDPKLPMFSDLHDIDYLHGYWVKINQSTNFSILGSVPEDKTIRLEGGWNLISYMCAENKNVSDVFSDIIDKIIVVNGFEPWAGGAKTYDPKLPDFSDLKEMKPDFGYWVKMNQSAILNYDSVC